MDDRRARAMSILDSHLQLIGRQAHATISVAILPGLGFGDQALLSLRADALAALAAALPLLTPGDAGDIASGVLGHQPTALAYWAVARLAESTHARIAQLAAEIVTEHTSAVR